MRIDCRTHSLTPTVILTAVLSPRVEPRGLWWPLDWDAQVRPSMTFARALNRRG